MALSPVASVNSPLTPRSSARAATALEQRERQAGRREDGAVLVRLALLPLAAVVEARLDLDAEAHLAAHADHPPDEPVPVRSRAVVDRHEVLDLADAVLVEEARDQDVRVREVELLRRPALGRRARSEVAAALGVEDRAEDARRVEAREQYQSIVPSVPTSATVWRSPMTPCSAIGR